MFFDFRVKRGKSTLHLRTRLVYGALVLYVVAVSCSVTTTPLSRRTFTLKIITRIAPRKHGMANTMKN